MYNILIQPTIETYHQYAEFASQYDLGFEIVDFANPSVISGDYETILRRYEAILEPSRIISAHGAYLDLYLNSPDPDVRNLAERRIEANLRIAQQLGLHYVIFHTNRLPMIRHERYHQLWIEAHIKFWRAILPKYELTVLLENMWDSTPDPIAKVLETVNSKKLRVCFDTDHYNIFSDVPIKTWFERLGAYITYIHLNDNLGDIDNELPPGQGSLDWKVFDEVIRGYTENPLVVLEVGSLEYIQQAIHYLKQNHIYPYV
jgi:sugar phosphate isomerase/epimerase